MNIQSNHKKKSAYLLVLLTLVSLLTFSSCGNKTTEEPKPDFLTLMSGEYQGSIKTQAFNFTEVKGTVKAGSTKDEVIFTEFIKGSDSTTEFKIQLKDSGSRQAIGLFLPEQRIGKVQVVGKVLGSSNTGNDHGYFLYQDLETKELINQFVFSISANGGDYVYTFDKKTE